MTNIQAAMLAPGDVVYFRDEEQPERSRSTIKLRVNSVTVYNGGHVTVEFFGGIRRVYSWPVKLEGAKNLYFPSQLGYE